MKPRIKNSVIFHYLSNFCLLTCHETHWKMASTTLTKVQVSDPHPLPPESEQPADPWAQPWFSSLVRSHQRWTNWGFFPVFPTKNWQTNELCLAAGVEHLQVRWVGWSQELTKSDFHYGFSQWLLVMTFWKDFGFGHKVVPLECYLLFEKFLYQTSQCHIYTSEN